MQRDTVPDCNIQNQNQSNRLPAFFLRQRLPMKSWLFKLKIVFILLHAGIIVYTITAGTGIVFKKFLNCLEIHVDSVILYFPFDDDHTGHTDRMTEMGAP